MSSEDNSDNNDNNYNNDNNDNNEQQCSCRDSCLVGTLILSFFLIMFLSGVVSHTNINIQKKMSQNFYSSSSRYHSYEEEERNKNIEK